MAHYQSYNTIPTELDELLADLNHDVQDLQKLEIYVAGAGIDSDDAETRRGIEEGRRETLERITNAGYEKSIRRIKWARGDSTQELIIDLDRKKAIYQETFDEYID